MSCQAACSKTDAKRSVSRTRDSGSSTKVVAWRRSKAPIELKRIGKAHRPRPIDAKAAAALADGNRGWSGASSVMCGSMVSRQPAGRN